MTGDCSMEHMLYTRTVCNRKCEAVISCEDRIHQTKPNKPLSAVCSDPTTTEPTTMVKLNLTRYERKNERTQSSSRLPDVRNIFVEKKTHR
jgi:hypothetical protein